MKIDSWSILEFFAFGFGAGIVLAILF